MIKVDVEKLADCLDDFKHLLKDHWKEVALNQDKIPLDPDYDKYLKLEELGVTHTVIVRDDDEIIGYFICMLSFHLHYQQTFYAVNDILYIKPEYRNLSVGSQMFTYAEKMLKEEGVEILQVHMKVDQPFDKLCEALGYENTERLYCKYLGD